MVLIDNQNKQDSQKCELQNGCARARALNAYVWFYDHIWVTGNSHQGVRYQSKTDMNQVVWYEPSPHNSWEASKWVNCFCHWQSQFGEYLEDTDLILCAKFQFSMQWVIFHVAHCRQSQGCFMMCKNSRMLIIQNFHTIGNSFTAVSSN